MQFSIVTPCFNGAKYFRKCLESVRDQDGVTLEHIIQDAGSTDGSIGIVREFPHATLHVETDKGMSDAINKGVIRTSGDWWMWLNTDDYLEPQALKQVAEFIAAHPEADVVYGDWNYVDQGGKLIRTAKCFPFSLRTMIHLGCYIASTATFFKRSATVARGELLAVPFKQVMDQEYFARLGTKGLRFVHLPLTLANFRLHGENTSTRYIGKVDMDSILTRQVQIAEAAAIRRRYGYTLSSTPAANWIVDGVLWYYYRFVKVFLKLLHGGYRK